MSDLSTRAEAVATVLARQIHLVHGLDEETARQIVRDVLRYVEFELEVL